MSGKKAGLVTGILLLVLGAALLGGGQSTAQAGPPNDAVLDWNLYAVQALINANTATPPGMGQPPPVSVLHMAMVQGAVYDAVNMIDGGHKAYLDGLPSATSTASKAAAVATAAHHVLVGVNITPALTAGIKTRLDDLLAASLAAAVAQDGASAVDDGIDAGEAAAAAMLAARQSDGRYGTFRFSPGTGIGVWQTTPPTFTNDPNGWVARVTPFAMKSTSQFRTAGPAKIGSGLYRQEYDEVKSFGGNGTTTPSLRTPEQTATAMFFTSHPGELFNRTFRGVAVREALTLVEQARLFAMLNIAAADAAIATWDDKAHWNFWRPYTAIRSDDGDPLTEPDPTWTPLVANPPYPDHPSGFNSQSGSVMHAAKAFFGRDLPISLTSAGVTREYERFTDVIDDTIDARVWLGLHFRSADVDAAWIGKRSANWVAAHFTPSN